MWLLSYNNGLRDVIRPIYGDRFHSMKAWTEMLTRYEYNDTVVFVSYETPIAALTNNVNGNGYMLYVSPYFDCSASTRCQFSRWLRENGLPDYHSIKDFMNDSIVNEIHDFDCRVCVMHSDDTLNNLF